MSTATYRTLDDGTIVIKNTRLSYESLHEARPVNNGAPRFSVQLMLDKQEHEDTVNMLRELGEAGLNEIKKKCKDDKWYIKDGDAKDAAPEYAGCWILSTAATLKFPPKLYGIDGKASSAKKDIYSGAYADAHIRPWIQDNEFGVRVNCAIHGVRATKAGERFGAAPPDSAGALGGEDDTEEDPFGDE